MSMDFPMIAGADLRRLRSRAGISLQAMATATECAPDDLAQIELGEQPVKPKMALVIINTVIEHLDERSY